MRETTGEHDGLRYLLWTPEEREEPRGVIVFLHGVGERAEEMPLEDVPVHSLPHLARRGRLPKVAGEPFPLLVACPQTTHRSWEPDAAKVGDLAASLAEHRYLTGISMGAKGCWSAAAVKSVFSALVPVSGSVPENAGDFQTQVWVFAGGRDRSFDAAEMERRLYAHRPRDERTRFDRYRCARHNGRFWNRVYRRSDLYEWLLP